jgi:hypothetical protein
MLRHLPARSSILAFVILDHVYTPETLAYFQRSINPSAILKSNSMNVRLERILCATISQF